MKSTDLLGTWSLESFVAKSDGGTVVFPFGDAPKGLITYTPAGYMAAVIMRSGRAKFASGDAFRGTPEEIKQAFEGFDAYAGRYEFDEATGSATHHVEAARFPNWEGTAQVRYTELVDAKLVISTPKLPAVGQTWVLTLTWRKM